MATINKINVNKPAENIPTIGNRLFNSYDRARTEKSDKLEKLGQVYTYCLRKAVGKQVTLTPGKPCDIKTANIALRILFGVAAAVTLPFTLIGILLTALSKTHKKAHEAAVNSLKIKDAPPVPAAPVLENKKTADVPAESKVVNRKPVLSNVLPNPEPEKKEEIQPKQNPTPQQQNPTPQQQNQTPQPKTIQPAEGQTIPKIIFKLPNNVHPLKQEQEPEKTQQNPLVNETKNAQPEDAGKLKAEPANLQQPQPPVQLTQEQLKAAMAVVLLANAMKNNPNNPPQNPAQNAPQPAPAVNPVQNPIHTNAAVKMDENTNNNNQDPIKNPVNADSKEQPKDQSNVQANEQKTNEAAQKPPVEKPKKLEIPRRDKLEDVKKFIEENPDELKPDLMIEFLTFKKQTHRILTKDHSNSINVLLYLIAEFDKKDKQVLLSKKDDRDALVLAIKRDRTDNFVIINELYKYAKKKLIALDKKYIDEVNKQNDLSKEQKKKLTKLLNNGILPEEDIFF